jgi:3-oxoacyl-[acyl-carrier protein] reductase
MLGIESVVQTGRKAIVTGAGDGVGKGIALNLANFGADIAVIDINERTAHKTADEVRALGRRALAITADVSLAPDVERAVDQAFEELGDLDILVNNAGYWDPAPAIWTTEKQWDDQLRVNLKSVFLMSKHVSGRWVRAGRRGNIVNITSVGGVRGSATYAAYGAAKAGTMNLTEVLALELGPYGIRVNAIAPDVIMTAKLSAGSPAELQRLEDMRSKVPLRRLGSLDDTAGAALFLVSDLSSWITGQTFIVDGGAMVSARVEGPHHVPPLDRAPPEK